MTFLPIVARELRAEARRPANYRLRVACAAGGMLAVVISLGNPTVPPEEIGPLFFFRLHAFLLTGLLLCVPLLVADCVSREKREGTLGLLLLTPLTATGIVVGKSVVQALRAVTLWLVLLPVVTIPFLFGGVGWFDVLSAFALEGCALILALAAGLLASSQARQWSTAVLLAEVYSTLFALGFGILLCWLLILQITPYVPFQEPPYPAKVSETLEITYQLCTADIPGRTGWSNAFSALLPGASVVWLQVLAQVMLLCLLILARTVTVAARRVEANRRDDPPTARQLQWQRLWLAPRFWLPAFRWKQRWHLDRNPIGWLQQYSTQARLIKWGCCLVVVVIESLAMGTHDLLWFYSFQPWHVRLGLFATLALAFSAAGSFRVERDSGVLELILVSPLKPKQIIAGRVCGLWGQFLPTYFVLLLSWGLMYGLRDGAVYVAGLLADFLFLPVVGLYFSLRFKHFIAAWLSTACVALFVPNVFGGVLGALWEAFFADWSGRSFLDHLEFHPLRSQLYHTEVVLFVGVLAEALCGWATWRLLHRCLFQRTFVQKPA